MAAHPSKTKVVVRKLPPMLAEEGFRAATDKVLAQLPTSWFAYCPGKVSAKHVIFSRAYINFVSPEGVVAFKAAFDGHVFVGSRGNQYRCSVEYAPYQKTPQPTKKKDRRDGTIASDPDYVDFCKQLEEGPVSLPSASAQLEAQERKSGAVGGGGDSAPVTTALMQYLQDRYSARPGLKLGALKKLKREEGQKSSKTADEKTLLKKQHNEKADGRGAGREAIPAKLGGKKGGQAAHHSGLQQQSDGPAKVLLKRPMSAAVGAGSGSTGVGNEDGKGKAKGKGAKDTGKQQHGQDRHTLAEPAQQQHVPAQKQQQPKPGQRQAAVQHDTHVHREQRKVKQDRPHTKVHDKEHAVSHDREHARGRDREHERAAKAEPHERLRQGGQPGQGPRPPSAAPADAARTSSTLPAPAAPQRAPQSAAAPLPTADDAAAAGAAPEAKRKVRRGFQAYVPGASRLSSARSDGDRSQAG